MAETPGGHLGAERSRRLGFATPGGGGFNQLSLISHMQRQGVGTVGNGLKDSGCHGGPEF